MEAREAEDKFEVVKSIDEDDKSETVIDVGAQCAVCECQILEEIRCKTSE